MNRSELARVALKGLIRMAKTRSLPPSMRPAGPGQPRAAAPGGPVKPDTGIRKYAGFVKLSHTVFALPFALASMVVAARETRGWPGWRLFGLIVLAMVTARTCAMSFNRIVDRRIDKANPRTAGRHLPTGQISLLQAWGLCIGSGAAFVATAYFINPICFYLSPVALAVICFYSLTKRFTDFTHVFLGLALALAPIGAWLAVTGGFTWWPMTESALLPILLGSAVVFWLIGFDIIYAIQDYEFDRKHGLHSVVVRWGIANALGISFLSHMAMWIVLGLFGLLSNFRIPYLIGLLIILVALVMEHWLARKRSLAWIDLAFFRLNAFISIVFLVVTVVEVVFPRFRIAR